MQVVVRTTDRVVVNYICTDAAVEQGITPVFRTFTRSNGNLDWHVVGGQAPFKVVKYDVLPNSGGCITVMDASGQTATGCGTIGEHAEFARVDCNTEPEEDTTVYRPAPTGNESFNYPVGGRKPLGPDQIPVGPDAKGTDPVDPTGAGPNDYRPPVKSPSPNGPVPPVGPVVPVKDPVHTPRPNDNPQPGPKPRPTQQPAPVHHPRLVSPPVRPTTTAPAPRPNTTTAPVAPAGTKSNL